MHRTFFATALGVFLVTLLSGAGIAQTTAAPAQGTTGQQAGTPTGTPSGQPHVASPGAATPGAQTAQPGSTTGSGQPGSMTGSGTNSPALERSYSGTSGMQSEAYGADRDRDGFNFGWLGLLGLAGLLGMRHSRRDHVAPNTANTIR